MKKLLVAILGVIAMTSAIAAWPTKSITIVVPYPPGGPTDVMMRNIQEDLQAELKTPIMLVNLPGANGTVAAKHIISERHDSHTFLFSDLDFVVGQSYAKTHLYKEFTPTNVVITTPIMMYGKSSNNNIVERFKSQLQNRSVVNVGYTGATLAWISQQKSLATLNLIPYKGAAPLQTDILGGHIEYALSGAGGAWNFIQNNPSIKPVMVTGSTRNPQFPNVPTAAELGFKGPNATQWWTFWALADTDPAIQQQFKSAISKVINKNKKIQALNETGYSVVNYNAVDTQKFINNEIKKYENISNNQK